MPSMVLSAMHLELRALPCFCQCPSSNDQQEKVREKKDEKRRKKEKKEKKNQIDVQKMLSMLLMGRRKM